MLRALDLPNGFPLWIVGNQLHAVTDDEPLEAQKTALLGASLVLSRELDKLQIKHIDVAVSPESLKKTARQILGEINSELPGRIIAYRGGHRWLPTLAAANPGVQETRLRAGAVYLMVNAFGSVGERFAEYLTQKAGVRLALADSLGLPGRELWTEWLAADSGGGRISEKILKILKLETATEVLAISGGFSDSQHAELMIEETVRHFGELDGVLYFFDAQEPTGETLDGRSAELTALDGALQGHPLDFRLLISSVPSAELASEDASVPFFFDSFVTRSLDRESQRWTSITWLPDESDAAGENAIARLFQVPFTSNLIVSPEPLSDGWNKFDAVLERPHKSEVSGPVSNYPRPNLRVAYSAPSTETEITIAQLWRELLGLKEIGVHDNFLELGGDSLMATRLISRMKDVFHQDLPVRLVFEASTVAELARAVDGAKAETMETATEEVEEMMKMLEQLSEEEVEQELLRRRSLAKGA
jgi:acyl carrier protein